MAVRTLPSGELLESQDSGFRTLPDGTGFLVETAGGGSLTQASRFDNTNAFYAGVATTGQVSLSAGLFSNINDFYAHTVTQGGSTQTLIQSSSFQNSNTFYASTVTPGIINLTASLFTNATTLFNPSVTVGSVTLFADLFNNSNAFYNHFVSNGGVVLQQTIRLDNVNLFYSNGVTPGAVNLSFSLFNNSNAFFSHTVSQAASQTLTQSTRFDNTSIFYVAAIGETGTTLTPADIAAIMAAMRIEFATELARIDVSISSRLASADYTAPDNAAISALPNAAEIATAVMHYTE